jgi:uncharacterized DUF497 family protein
MIFEWDEAKSQRTLKERGFDFDYAARVFEDERRLERVDRRRDYGEERRQTIGKVERKTYFVVFTVRGDVLRIISARRAHDHEDRAYRKVETWR